MTVGRGGGEPFTWNVAGLLAEPPGASREYPIAGVTIDVGPDLRLADPIEGRVQLRKTNRGILANAHLTTSLASECSRCLRDIEVPIEIELTEEFLPSIDLVTGQPTAADEPDALRLTDHHELELETPVREAIQLAEPIAPLCRPDCPGLCAVCGQRLESGSHDHPDDDIDPRLEALRSFRVDGEPETG
ncbi:MAG: YceD family protein [Chloroflexota bacterium]